MRTASSTAGRQQEARPCPCGRSTPNSRRLRLSRPVSLPTSCVAELIRTPADGVGRGFSGSEDADRLKRHESGRRTMAHVAGHLSFETLTDLQRAIADRCRVLDGDQLSLGTNFHWWPKPIIPA